MARLRLATPEDAAAVHGIYAPVVERSTISFEEAPPTVEGMRDRIVETLERLPWLVCERGDVVGYALAHPHRERAAYRWAVDTSVYVAEPARRSGVGRGLYTALFGVLREQGYVHAYAGTTLPNPPSEGLHRAVGFEPVGTYEDVGHKHGAWRDVRWWHRQLRPLPDVPEEPRPIDAVVEADGWERALEAGEAEIAG